MSQNTRQDIIACTLELAAKKPLGRISVREITAACGVTRNTFYYHFHDIYEVVTSFFEEEAGARFSEAVPLETRLLNFLELCSGYKSVWQNLYRAIGYEQFSRYIVSHIHPILLDAIGQEHDIAALNPDDLDLICAFYEEAICGALLRWLRSRKHRTPEDMMALLNRAKYLFDGQIEKALERSRIDHTPDTP